MWGRTFGFVNMVYLMMYCCFVCAGVDVILLRVGNDGIKQEALGRVLLGLEILEAASSQGPGESLCHRYARQQHRLRTCWRGAKVFVAGPYTLMIDLNNRHPAGHRDDPLAAGKGNPW